MTPNCRMIDPLLKSALEVWHTFGATPESHFLAKVVSTFSANTTFTTRNANL